MRKISISVPPREITKLYPSTLEQCSSINCDGCLVAEFIVDGKCPHERVLAKYFKNSPEQMREITLEEHHETIEKSLPETHQDCCKLGCSKCIMGEFRFQKDGTGAQTCSYRNMLSKYKPATTEHLEDVINRIRMPNFGQTNFKTLPEPFSDLELFTSPNVPKGTVVLIKNFGDKSC